MNFILCYCTHGIASLYQNYQKKKNKKKNIENFCFDSAVSLSYSRNICTGQHYFLATIVQMIVVGSAISQSRFLLYSQMQVCPVEYLLEVGKQSQLNDPIVLTQLSVIRLHV